MGPRRCLEVSMESLAYQTDGRLFRAIVASVQTIRNSEYRLTTKDKDNADLIKESGIESRIFDLTGIRIKLKSGSHFGINAYVMPPQLDRNHPLVDDVAREFVSNKDAVTRIKKAKTAIHGSIDLEKGVVSGVYSEIESELFVATQILQDDLFTVEEAAAIIGHEIGHLMTYYEYLGRNVVLNHVLGDLSREFNESTSRAHRVEIIKSVKDTLDLDAVDPDAVADIKRGETVQTLVLSEYANKWVSATKTHLYDYRNWEAMADQFVSRIGGAKDLATALDKIYRLHGDIAYMSNVKFLILSTFASVLLLPWAPFILLVMALSEPWEIYDPIGERIERIRRDIVNAMKQPNIDKEYRLRLQGEIGTLDRLSTGITNREGVILIIWKNIFPAVRKQTDRAKMMQDLERLANNELFVSANKLMTMA